MARVETNAVSLAYGIQSAIDVDPTAWKLLEPNDIGKIAAEISTVARSPISRDRQRKKGTITDLDSSAEFDADLTLEAAHDFLEGFVGATSANLAAKIVYRQSGSLFNDLVAVNSTSSFDHDAISTAGLVANTLIYTRGFATAANNGLFIVDAASTTTSTIVTVAPTDETPTNVTNATMTVCGRRATTADLTWTDASSTLGSTALDFTTLGLSVGQFVHIGGLTTTNQFARGVARGRIVSIAATAIVFDKLVGPLVGGDDAGTGKVIDILYGRFIRNVEVTDTEAITRWFQFELLWPDLQEPSGTGDEYEYSINNLANEISINVPLTEKATLSCNFIGTDTEAPVTTQKSGASTPAAAVMTTAFNTTSDMQRLRITEYDETGLTTYLKSTTLTLRNGVSPEKVIGVLGAVFMNRGTFEVDLETQVVFTDGDVIAAIRNNSTVTFEMFMENDDGGMYVDIPSMTLGNGARDLPRNESVLVNLTGTAFKDATLGYSVSFSLFPVLP